MTFRPKLDWCAELDALASAIAPHVDALRQQSPWIDTVRRATGISVIDLGRRMKSAQSNVSRLQKGEVDGTITVRKLRDAADALDCDLVYAFVPRRSFAALAEESQARLDARSRPISRDIPRRPYWG